MSATVRNESLLGEVNELLPGPLKKKLHTVTRTNESVGYSGTVERSAPFHSFLEHSTVLLFPILFALNVYFAVSRLHAFDSLWWILAAIPLGIVGGDLISGVVHWFADTYFSEDTPIIGPSLIKPFRLHHIYPRDICMHNFVEITGNVCIMAVPVLTLCLYLLWLMPESGWVAFIVVCIAVVAATTVATNHFHKWAHEENPATLPRLLQRTRLVLGPSHHQRHHTPPFDLHYCITNGWLNPFLNRIKFFRRLEIALSFVGVRPAEPQHNRDKLR